MGGCSEIPRARVCLGSPSNRQHQCCRSCLIQSAKEAPEVAETRSAQNNAYEQYISSQRSSMKLPNNEKVKMA